MFVRFDWCECHMVIDYVMCPHSCGGLCVDWYKPAGCLVAPRYLRLLGEPLLLCMDSKHYCGKTRCSWRLLATRKDKTHSVSKPLWDRVGCAIADVLPRSIVNSICKPAFDLWVGLVTI